MHRMDEMAGVIVVETVIQLVRMKEKGIRLWNFSVPVRRLKKRKPNEKPANRK